MSSITSKKIKDYCYEGAIRILCHNVTYWFRSESKADNYTIELLKEEAETRAKECINNEYYSGELNYETDNFSASGWWKIENN